MRIFHELVFDGMLAYGATQTSVNRLTPFELNEHLGSVDHLSVSGYVDQVTGGATSLTINIQRALDQFTFYEVGSAVSIPLVVGAETLFQGVDLDPITAMKPPFARLRVSVGGATGPVTARVRVWATGRDYSRRAMTRRQVVPPMPGQSAPNTMER